MTKLSKIRGIKEREKANDILYTPVPVAMKLIEMTDIKETDKVLDPCKGEGAFFDHLPNCEKDYCEIIEGKDFFDYDKGVDVIICNPPFSIYTRWINKIIYLSPKKIAFVMGSLNLTTKRLKILEDGGYFLTKMHIVNVRGWFSNTLLVVFEKGGDPIIGYEPGWF